MVQNPPQKLSGTQGPWLSFADAVALKGVDPPPGPNDKYIVFAFIGTWKGKEPPVADGNGKVPAGSINYLNADGSIAMWDYSIYQPSTNMWINANYSVDVAAQKGVQQQFYVGPKVNPLTPGGGVVYYAYIVPGKQ